MNTYTNLKIGTKLILGFMGVALLFGGIGIYAVNCIVRLSDSSTEPANGTIMTMSVLFAAAVILSILIGIFISSTIAKPCKKAIYMLDEMSRGHFEERMNLGRRDEIGQMVISWTLSLMNCRQM